MLALQLGAAGHRTLEAADGREGLRLVGSGHPDLVITDVLMPVMDGYELVRQMRLDPASRAIPVVFSTAEYGAREARALALKSGVAFVLTKPAGTERIQAIVERALSGAATDGDDGEPLGPAFDREHLQLLTDKVSEQTEDLRASNARLRALINIGLELASERDPDLLLKRVCAASRELFGATYVTLGILDLHDRTVQQVVSCGLDGAPWISPGDPVSGILQTVVAERRSIRGDRGGEAAVAFQFPAKHPEVQAFLAAPIASPANVYGWLCFVGNDGRPFSADDEDLVMALSGQVGRIYESGHFHAVAEKRALALEAEAAERRLAEDALRASERLNRNLVEHLPHRILVKDRDSNVLFCNANYARDLGLRVDEVIGHNATAFYPPALADAYNLDDQEVMRSGVIKDIEEPHQSDGHPRWVHTVKVPYRDESGSVIGVLVLFEDITERRSLEAQYQQAQKMEAIGQLAGGIAHDFNNLLTVILGNSELLLAAIDPTDERHGDVIEIRKAGASAAALTRQLLTFSRKEIVQPVRLDLNAVLEGMRLMLERLIGHDIRVRLVLRPGLAPVIADRGQIEQIVMNLVVNARDSMPRGGSLTVETANVELDLHYARSHHAVVPGAYVALMVTDTGTGITPEVQARLFEPFFTTKEPGKGTGLGLATVHGIVARSGGSVCVYSEIGSGTTFTVYLPQEDGGPGTAVTPPAPQSKGSETVLVVDDVAALCELTRRLLEPLGYTVLLAGSADEAAGVFSAHPDIELLVTDIVMPGGSGPDLTTRLHAVRPALKVLYMSGYAEDAMLHRGVLDEGVAFLRKPFTADTLAQAVRAALDR